MNIIACIKSVIKSSYAFKIQNSDTNRSEFIKQLEELLSLTTNKPNQYKLLSTQRSSVHNQFVLPFIVVLLNTIHSSYYSQPHLTNICLQILNQIVERPALQKCLRCQMFQMTDTLVSLFSQKVFSSIPPSPSPELLNNQFLCIRVLYHLICHNDPFTINHKHYIDLITHLITTIMSHHNDDDDLMRRTSNEEEEEEMMMVCAEPSAESDLSSQQTSMKYYMGVLYNITKLHPFTRHHIMSQTNVKAVIKKLMSHMKSHSVKEELFAVGTLKNLCMDHSTGSEVFSSHNIIKVFQLLFKELLHLDNKNNKQILACEIFCDLIRHHSVSEAFSSYKYLEQCLSCIATNIHNLPLMQFVTSICLIEPVKRKMVTLLFENCHNFDMSKTKCPLYAVLYSAVKRSEMVDGKDECGNIERLNEDCDNEAGILTCMQLLDVMVQEVSDTQVLEHIFYALQNILSQLSSSPDCAFHCAKVLSQIIKKQGMLTLNSDLLVSLLNKFLFKPPPYDGVADEVLSKCCIQLMLLGCQSNHQPLLLLIKDNAELVLDGLKSKEVDVVHASLQLTTLFIHLYSTPSLHFATLLASSNDHATRNDTSRKFNVYKDKNLAVSSTNSHFNIEKLSVTDGVSEKLLELLQDRMHVSRATEVAFDAAIECNQAVNYQLKLQLVHSESQSKRLCHLLQECYTEKEKNISNTNNLEKQIKTLTTKLEASIQNGEDLQKMVASLKQGGEELRRTLKERDVCVEEMRKKMEEQGVVLEGREKEVHQLEKLVEKLREELQEAAQQHMQLKQTINNNEMVMRQQDAAIKEKEQMVELLNEKRKKMQQLLEL